MNATATEQATNGMMTPQRLEQLFLGAFYKVSWSENTLMVDTERFNVVVGCGGDYVCFRLYVIIDATLDDETLRELANAQNLQSTMVRVNVLSEGRFCFDYDLLIDEQADARRIMKNFRRFEALSGQVLEKCRQAVAERTSYSARVIETAKSVCH